MENNNELKMEEKVNTFDAKKDNTVYDPAADIFEFDQDEFKLEFVEIPVIAEEIMKAGKEPEEKVELDSSTQNQLLGML